MRGKGLVAKNRTPNRYLSFACCENWEVAYTYCVSLRCNEYRERKKRKKKQLQYGSAEKLIQTRAANDPLISTDILQYLCEKKRCLFYLIFIKLYAEKRFFFYLIYDLIRQHEYNL